MGMHCSACHQIIEFRLKKMPGIQHFNISVAAHTADLKWNPAKVSLAEIMESINALGYAALPIGSAGELINREYKMSIWRLFIAGFAMMQIMMYALPAYLVPVPQIDGDLTPDIDRLLKLASLAITIPVVIFSAWPFFQSARRDIRNRHIGMDIPVSVGYHYHLCSECLGHFPWRSCLLRLIDHVCIPAAGCETYTVQGT